jgi:hypothetical protein
VNGLDPEPSCWQGSSIGSFSGSTKPKTSTILIAWISGEPFRRRCRQAGTRPVSIP